MSSHTDTRKAQHSRAALAASRANAWSRLVKIIGVAAAAAGIGLALLFVFQAGILAPPAPEEVKTGVKIDNPEQFSGTSSRITGIDKNQRPFVITADSGVQDKAVETLVHLNVVTGTFERPTGDKLDVTAVNGHYDTKSKGLDLDGNVVFKENTRFTANMDKAFINTDDQTMQSRSPVDVDMQGTMIKAGSMQVTEDGNRVLFKGGVKAHFVIKKN